MASLNRTAEVVWRALASELSAGANIPLTTKVKLWRAGFKGASYELFGLAHNDPRDYVSDLEVARARRINGAFGHILKDKLLFAPTLAPYARVPEVLGIVERGRVYPIAEAVLTGVDALLEVAAERAVILKPSQGNKGRGVLSLKVDAEPVLSGRPVSREEVARTVGALDGYLIVERVQQAAYAEAIFPDATNTIRIITMRDPVTDEVFIPAAMHRFGSSSTGPTDNFQTGGVSVGVDLDSGRLGRAVRFPTFTGGALRWLDAHPDTQAPIQGVTVPNWAEVKGAVTRVVDAYRFLIYVGWDVVVTDEGVVIIEGNHNINLGLQVHGPLLKHPQTRRFFEHYGVVSRR